MPRQSFISIGWKLSIFIIFTDVKLFVQASLVWSNFIHELTEFWSRASLRFYLDRLRIVDSGPLWKLSVLTFSPDVKDIVHASLVWRNWARDFKFNTHINQGLKSCLVIVSSRSVENCRFWSTLKSSEKFIFRWGNASDNIRYYHLSVWYVLT